MLRTKICTTFQTMKVLDFIYSCPPNGLSKPYGKEYKAKVTVLRMQWAPFEPLIFRLVGSIGVCGGNSITSRYTSVGETCISQPFHDLSAISHF